MDDSICNVVPACSDSWWNSIPSILGNKYAYAAYPYSYSSWGKSNFYLDMEGRSKIMLYENTISKESSVSIPAYGLTADQITVKEVDGKLTITSKGDEKVTCKSFLNTTYTLKNVTLKSTKLELGVLTLEFIDAPNVIIHKVN